MNDADMTAIATAISTKEAKEAKNNMNEGEHQIDLFVRIFGKLTKKVSDKNSTCSIPWLKTLAIALHKSGIQKNNILFAIEEAIKISMTLGQDEIAEMIGMQFEEIDKLVKTIQKDIVAKLPKTEVIRVNSKLIVEEIQLENSEQELLVKTA